MLCEKQSERGSEKEEREKESEMNNSSSGWRRFTYGEPQQRRLRAATTAGDMAGAAERDDELDRGVNHGRSQMRRFRDRKTTPRGPELQAGVVHDDPEQDRGLAGSCAREE